MPDFSVDIGGLDALRKNLDRCAENLEQALKRMKDIGPSSIGPDDLDAACTDFKDSWEGGLDKIEEAVGGIQEGLSGAIKGYVELENGIKENLARMTSDMRD